MANDDNGAFALVVDTVAMWANDGGHLAGVGGADDDQPSGLAVLNEISHDAGKSGNRIDPDVGVTTMPHPNAAVEFVVR